MTTTTEIVTGALRAIAVINDSESPTAAQSNYGAAQLTDYLNGLNARGAVYPTVSLSIGDTVNLPAELIGPMKLALGMNLADRYGKQLSGLLLARMMTADRQILAYYTTVENAQIDSGLTSMPNQIRQY